MAIAESVNNALTSIGNALPPLGGGESKNKVDERREELRLMNECRAQGGVWDPESKTCKLPQPTKPVEEEQQVNPQQEGNQLPQIFQSEETDRASGITLPDGRTFLGLGPDDVNRIAQGEQQRTAIPEGTVTVNNMAVARRQAQMRLQQAAQVGQIDIATAQQLEEMGIDWKQAILAGTANIIPNTISFAATGAAAGAVAGGGIGSGITAPAGAAIGAIAGAIKGFYNGVNANIKNQRGDFLSIKSKNLGQRYNSLKKYIYAVNADPNHAEDYIQAFNMELSLIRKDYNNLHRQANEDLSKWQSQDGSQELAKYEIFFESTQPLLELKMQQAVQSPSKSNAFLDLEDLQNLEDSQNA